VNHYATVEEMLKDGADAIVCGKCGQRFESPDALLQWRGHAAFCYDGAVVVNDSIGACLDEGKKKS
jgi:hypothetical protein